LESGVHLEPLLSTIAAQAEQADQSRSVSAEVVAAIKASDVMRMSACSVLGGLEASTIDIAKELSALAPACTSTAWCLWNHLCTFHLFCGLLGPEHIEFLRGITQRHEWVCFPAGASSAVRATDHGDTFALQGTAAFGSGARYAEWAGVSFAADDTTNNNRKPEFTMVDLRSPNVRIDPTWKAMSLRASATDHVHYEGVRIPAQRRVPFYRRYREVFRDPEHPMIHHRYREDWVALSDLWLGAMAVGLTQAAIDECCEGIQERIAIMGTKMVQRPTIHVNVGQAGALIAAARDTVFAALAETDQRIAAAVIPTESDYLRQVSASMQALLLCDEAMRLILRVLGGNGLREGGTFERRYRDFQAMPLHINAHRDRVTEQLGRHMLGLPTENPF
jgi:alkylation response protein AidB-like acyl-CoA dehydrogenase